MFRFKQFTIHQDRCAMKVCTDACLFGAWVADRVERAELAAENILDIGTGTGLLSLMLAQKTNAAIDAVEINADAFEQAKENIQESPWKENIRIYHSTIADFSPGKKYELIICNPPFYENHLTSPDKDRNTAMHAGSLSFSELLLYIKNNLSPEGKAAVLLPHNQIKHFENFSTAQCLFITEKLNISHSPQHPFFRAVLILSPGSQEIKETDIPVKDSNGRYSEAFTGLLKDYYLLL